MYITEAIEILTHHNRWRRGLEDESKYTPKEIGISIDVILQYLLSRN